MATIQLFISESQRYIQPFDEQLSSVQADVQRLIQNRGEREQLMDEKEQEKFEKDIKSLESSLADLQMRFPQWEVSLQEIQQSLRPDNAGQVAPELVKWLGRIRRDVQESTLIQARARLEQISVDSINLDSRARPAKSTRR